MNLIVAVVVCLAFAAVVAHLMAHRAWKEAGLPIGEVVYQDTDAGQEPCGPLVSARLGLVGRPDYLIRTPEGLVPVEIKTSAMPPLGAYPNHVLQLLGYCALVEDAFGETVGEGLLRYRDGEVRIPFGAAERQRVHAVLSEIAAAKGGSPVFRNHSSRNRCRGCVVRGACPDAL